MPGACDGNQPPARRDRAKTGSEKEAQGRRAIAAQEPGGAQTGRGTPPIRKRKRDNSEEPKKRAREGAEQGEPPPPDQH